MLPTVSSKEYAALLSQTADLLDNPDFATWFAQSDAIHEYVDRPR